MKSKLSTDEVVRLVRDGKPPKPVQTGTELRPNAEIENRISSLIPRWLTSVSGS